MLRISKALSASQAQTYHAREFTSPDQSYWSRGQEVSGEWQGQLAERFDLCGSVGAEEFARLSEGQHPQTGEALIRRAARMASSPSTSSALGKAVGSSCAKVGDSVSVPTRRAVAAPSMRRSAAMVFIGFHEMP